MSKNRANSNEIVYRLSTKMITLYRGNVQLFLKFNIKILKNQSSLTRTGSVISLFFFWLAMRSQFCLKDQLDYHKQQSWLGVKIQG